MQFKSHGLTSGIWSGTLTGRSAPARLTVTLRGEDVAQASLTPLTRGEWQVRATLPAAVLSDGAHSLSLVSDHGAVLARLPVIAGAALDDDLVAEIAFLRDELELLKREFRHFASGN